MESQTCSNPDCQIAENGSCLQGHDPVISCPNFGGEQVVVLPEEPEGLDDLSDAPVEQASSMTQLSSGLPYTQKDVDAFLLTKPAQLVAIVGDFSSGKSTLLCAVYDRFARGAFADRTFAGSATLTAFEQIVHFSRAASLGIVPDTKRTSLSQGLQYYHLATVHADTVGVRSDLFMSDRAGETYSAGLDQPGDLLDLPELRLARTIAVLIDGTRLSNQTEQHQVLESVRQFVRCMFDSGAISPKQHLQLVLTKRDDVERSGRADILVANARDVMNRLKRDFGSGFASIEFYEVAARDPSNVFEPAFGCDTLLKSWIGTPEPRTHAVKPARTAEGHFDRLTLNQTFGLET